MDELLRLIARLEFGTTWGRLNCVLILACFSVARWLLTRTDRVLELRYRHIKHMSITERRRALSQDSMRVPSIVLGFILSGFLCLVVCSLLLFFAQGARTADPGRGAPLRTKLIGAAP